jgi:hypothetical protein
MRGCSHRILHGSTKQMGGIQVNVETVMIRYDSIVIFKSTASKNTIAHLLTAHHVVNTSVIAMLKSILQLLIRVQVQNVQKMKSLGSLGLV